MTYKLTISSLSQIFYYYSNDRYNNNLTSSSFPTRNTALTLRDVDITELFGYVVEVD